MDVIFFKLLALLYTTLIVIGTIFVPGYIVNSKIILLKELLLANPDTALIKIKSLISYNSLPDKDIQMIEKEIIYSKET